MILRFDLWDLFKQVFLAFLTSHNLDFVNKVCYNHPTVAEDVILFLRRIADHLNPLATHHKFPMKPV